MSDWKISEMQKKLLDALFEKVEGKVEKALDMGTGRTSLQYLTGRYPDIKIRAVVYPGDIRKLDPIKECVTNTNFEIVESDIKNLDKSENYDVVLAHLFLGESRHFDNNSFEEILNNLFAIKTRYLVIVNVSYDDCIDYFPLLKKIALEGEIVGLNYVPSSEPEPDPREKFGGGCIGMCIKKNEKTP